MNAYASDRPRNFEPDLRMVLPLRVTDVLAHAQRLIYSFVNRMPCASFLPHEGPGPAASVLENEDSGSNGWAIAPSHSVNGNALLLVNPHSPWAGRFTWQQTQLRSPDIDAYGVAWVGLPVLMIEFNDHLGWTVTTNPIDTCDAYKITEQGSGYAFDGRTLPFHVVKKTIAVHQPDGTLRSSPLMMRSTIQGPYITGPYGNASIRMLGVTVFPVYGSLQQLWGMAQNADISQFRSALRENQLPLWNILYADQDEHILYYFGGEQALRPFGDWTYWQSTVPGDTSSTLWTQLQRVDDNPLVVEPPSGWVQNSNGPPWYATLPALQPNDYVPDTAPDYLFLREQAAIRAISAAPLSLDRMQHYLFSAHAELSDRVLDDLFKAVAVHGNAESRRAADILRHWDRAFLAESRGAVLFWNWVNFMRFDPFGNYGMAVTWNSADPLNSLRGFPDPVAADQALRRAAQLTIQQTGSLDAPWGAFLKIRRNGIVMPANGAPSERLGVFSDLIYYGDGTADPNVALGGNSYMALVDFSHPVKVRVLMVYGTSSQPHSRHNGDELSLYNAQRMHPAWFSPAEYRAHTELVETLEP